VPYFEGQSQPQPEHSFLPVFLLAAPFAGLGGNLRWPMQENDRRFDLVAVLASRPRPFRGEYRNRPGAARQAKPPGELLLPSCR
jgi:hypothetical protein